MSVINSRRKSISDESTPSHGISRFSSLSYSDNDMTPRIYPSSIKKLSKTENDFFSVEKWKNFFRSDNDYSRKNITPYSNKSTPYGRRSSFGGYMEEKSPDTQKYGKPLGINITSDMIIKASNNIVYANRHRDLDRDGFFPFPKGTVEEQEKIEKELIQNFKACPDFYDPKDLIPYLYNLNDFNGLKKELVFNGNANKMVTCLTKSLTTNSEIDGYERFKYLIKKIKKLDVNSANGFVFIADFIVDDLFVVKVPQNLKDNAEMIHEVAVGFYATNDLRSNIGEQNKNGKLYGTAIPNFSYIYGIIGCSSPSVEYGKVISWCDSTNSSANYAIYENISDSVSFTAFVKTCSYEEFIMNFLQIVLALREASLRSNFTHYDLHTGNVIVRNIGHEFYIPYYTSRGLEYIKSSGTIPTIIDYGMSCFSLEDGTTLGYNKNYSLEKLFIYKNYSKIEYDIYKLLCYSLNGMVNRNIFGSLSMILEYFNKKETPMEILRNQEDTFYALPNGLHFDIDDFIEYLRKFSDGLLVKTPPKGHQVLNCTDMNCYSFNDAIDIIKKSKNELYNKKLNLIYFYDTISNLRSEEEKDRFLRYFMNNFNFKNERSSIENKLYFYEKYAKNKTGDMDFYMELKLTVKSLIYLSNVLRNYPEYREFIDEIISLKDELLGKIY